PVGNAARSTSPATCWGWSGPSTGRASAWKASHPHLAAKLDEEIEDCLACYAFPAAHRPRIRTTNGLERLNQELKRRTRVVRVFPHREAAERLGTPGALEPAGE